MMSQSGKKWLIGSLACCFFGQTAMVYSDESDTRMSDSAVAGAKLWHEGNCQSCHQIYGFGGFLGPDLTNAASRLGEGFEPRLQAVVSEGPGQMPAYSWNTAQVRTIAAFLTELDATGVGQARHAAATDDPRASIDALVSERSSVADDNVQSGHDVLASRPCMACHQMFRAGVNRAPEFTLLAERLDDAQLDVVLSHGKPPLMPAPVPAFTDEERRDVAAYLNWLSSERETLRADVAPALGLDELDWEAVPWWEFQ